MIQCNLSVTHPKLECFCCGAGPSSLRKFIITGTAYPELLEGSGPVKGRFPGTAPFQAGYSFASFPYGCEAFLDENLPQAWIGLAGTIPLDPRTLLNVTSTYGDM
jgi:hypothetical protein